VSSLYLVVCRLLAFLLLVTRGDRSKELEILVLRHELSILRRHVGRARRSLRGFVNSSSRTQGSGGFEAAQLGPFSL
jgi:hypothetical protein